jgi:chitinase
MASEDFTVENYWSLGTTIFQHDRRCYSRWEGQPLSRPEIRGMRGWRPLFTMNQFHGVPLVTHASSDNGFDALKERYEGWCGPAAGRKPNYVAVDFHERGDVERFVEWLNARPRDVP